MTATPESTYWLTRDSDGTGLSELVDVWTQRPTRVNLFGGGTAWLHEGITGVEHRFAQWTLTETRLQCHVVPDTSLECIRVGHE
jgi:hypothetical protein